MKTIVVKTPFLDKEHGNARRKPGDKLRRALERAKFLVDLGFAIFGDDEEADQVIEQAKQGPKEISVIKSDPQWAEVTEVNNKKVAPKKVAKKK